MSNRKLKIYFEINESKAKEVVQLLKQNDFSSETIIITAFLLGLLLIAVAFFTQSKKIKPHFEFTYSNFGTHLIFISLIAALIQFGYIYFIVFIVLAAISFFFYKRSIEIKSFYFLLITTLYFYIGLSYTIVRFLLKDLNADIGGVYLSFMYFIASAVAVVAASGAASVSPKVTPLLAFFLEDKGREVRFLSLFFLSEFDMVNGLSLDVVSPVRTFFTPVKLDVKSLSL